MLLLPMVGATAALVTPRQTRTEPCATVTYQQARGARYVNVSTALACLRSVELDVVRDVSLLDL